jgi:hypothetical protein
VRRACSVLNCDPGQKWHLIRAANVTEHGIFPPPPGNDRGPR